ncbi:VOC family protein [Palleronia sp. KMU-117]|uniref:VOC family protein n=1 Tax=Palleronia sp. KMU-117 TaxID=3434108 RepID=UPI003D721416
MRRRVSEIALLVPDYEAAIAFYVGVLGFDLRSDIDLGAGKRWVTVAPEGAETALLLARAADDRQRAAIGAQAGGRVAFFLETDDFPRDHRQMTDRGVIFEEAPRHEDYGIVAVWRDPFGNRWDLLQRR